MKEICTSIKTIWKEDRAVIVMMIIVMIMGLVFCTVTIFTLNPANSVTKIGYGDIGGYRDGAWTNMLSWPLLALVLTFFNNLIAVRVWKRSGGGMARLLIGMTMMLIVVGMVVLVRLLGES